MKNPEKQQIKKFDATDVVVSKKQNVNYFWPYCVHYKSGKK